MKRFYNMRVCRDWHRIVVPRSLLLNYINSTWIRQWCWQHNSTGRYYISAYSGIWFEQKSDAEAFQAIVTFRLLQT